MKVRGRGEEVHLQAGPSIRPAHDQPPHPASAMGLRDSGLPHTRVHPGSRELEMLATLHVHDVGVEVGVYGHFVRVVVTVDPTRP